jgi:cell division protein FtsB
MHGHCEAAAAQHQPQIGAYCSEIKPRVAERLRFINRHDRKDAMQLLKLRFDYVVVVACVVTLMTFGWHGFAGERSTHYFRELQVKHDGLEVKLAQLTDEKNAMEKKLDLLRPESVRAHLGLVKSNDLVIMTGSVD